MSASEVWFVTGPPGTGQRKTTYLARQAQAAAERHSPDSIVIASLTRAAAAEIGDTKRDKGGVPEENVGTLHAHCYRALDRPELAETPEGVRAWNDHHPHAQLSRGANQLEDTITGDGGQGAGDDLHHQIMTLRARMIPRERWTPDQQAHDTAWTDWKAQTGRVDFTDLIERALTEVPYHPAMPRVLLLDEAQDFSRLELALATRWAHRADTTVMVGDPDQCVYAWRGADPETVRHLELTGERTLTQSYRVPHSVHSLATRWIEQIADRRYVGYAPTDVQGSVERAAGVSLRNPDALIDQLADEAGEGETMVLASCRYMLAPLIAGLRSRGVPFHNPYRSNDGGWNPMRAANRLKAFLRPDERVWGEHARAWTWDDLRLWTEPLQARGNLARGAKTLIEAKCLQDRFGESRADEIVDIEIYEQLFGAAPPDHPAYRLDVDWYFDALRAEGRKTLTYPVKVLRERGPRALVEKPRVIVGTVHSTKGGECDHVVVAPDLSVAGYWHGWHPGGAGRDQIVRMMYVALTRARETVTILDPAGPEHVPAHLLDVGEAIAA